MDESSKWPIWIERSFQGSGAYWNGIERFRDKLWWIVGAYRNTGGGDDIPMHLSVIVAPEWPVSTMIFEPDRIFGGTEAIGSVRGWVFVLFIWYSKIIKNYRVNHYLIIFHWQYQFDITLAFVSFCLVLSVYTKLICFWFRFVFLCFDVIANRTRQTIYIHVGAKTVPIYIGHCQTGIHDRNCVKHSAKVQTIGSRPVESKLIDSSLTCYVRSFLIDHHNNENSNKRVVKKECLPSHEVGSILNGKSFKFSKFELCQFDGNSK